jgi:uncharacterized alpha-E superfamily protein
MSSENLLEKELATAISEVANATEPLPFPRPTPRSMPEQYARIEAAMAKMREEIQHKRVQLAHDVNQRATNAKLAFERDVLRLRHQLDDELTAINKDYVEQLEMLKQIADKLG